MYCRSMRLEVKKVIEEEEEEEEEVELKVTVLLLEISR